MIVKYINSKGVEVNLNKDPYKMLVSDLLDYEWEVLKSSNKISGFEKSVSEKTINIDIMKNKSKTARQLMNELSFVFESDIVNRTPGKLYIDDNYMRCYIYASEKSSWETSALVVCEYSLITDEPFWVNEIKKSFLKSGGGAVDNFDYPYNYDYDYSEKVFTNVIENPGYMEADFKMIIYGPVVNPSVEINGNIYQIITEVKESEYIVIDSLEHLVELVDENGNATNKYNARNKNWNIYQKIIPGTNKIVWPGDFGVDMVLYVKRSEPEWNS